MKPNIIVINEDSNITVQIGSSRGPPPINTENVRRKHPTLGEIYERIGPYRERKTTMARKINNPLQEQMERARQKRENSNEPNLFLNRPDFLKRVFWRSFFFSLLAFLNWVAFAKYIENWDGLYMKVSISAGCLALLSFIVILVFVKIRYVFPINWILTLCIIEGSCIFAALLNESNVFADLFWTYVVALSVETFFILISFCLNRKFLPGPCLFSIGICTLLGSVFLYILLHYMEKLKAHANFVAIFLACMVVVTLYHGEIVCGLRFGLLRKDHLYCSILIYVDFVAYYMIAYHIIYDMCVYGH